MDNKAIGGLIGIAVDAIRGVIRPDRPDRQDRPTDAYKELLTAVGGEPAPLTPRYPGLRTTGEGVPTVGSNRPEPVQATVPLTRAGDGLVGREDAIRGLVPDQRYSLPEPASGFFARDLPADHGRLTLMSVAKLAVASFARRVNGQSSTVAVAVSSPAQHDYAYAQQATLSMEMAGADPQVSYSPRTRSTEVQVTIPVELRFTVSFTDVDMIRMQRLDGDSMERVLDSLLTLSLERRFGEVGTGERRQSPSAVVAQPAAPVEGKGKRRLIIPDGGNQS